MQLPSFRPLASLLLPLLLLAVSGCGKKDSAVAEGGPVTIRIGHFPNITHAQGVIAHQLSDEGKGWFEERLGKDVKVQWFVYNAGPSAIEAIFAGSIDVTYIGPNPVLNGYAKSRGEEIRVISGATSGGASLVVKAEGGPATPADFKGKKIATPQFGNTQDVAARVWLGKQGFNVTQTGGDVFVIPTENPNQLPLFQKGEIDAVWTVEPWVSRLELEAGGKIFLEQKDDFATVLASSTEFLKKHPDLAKKVVAAHKELSEWIIAHPVEAKELVNKGIKAATKRDLPPQLMDRAWPRLRFSSEVSKEGFDHMVKEAQSVGWLKDAPPLDRLIAIP